MVEAEKKVTKGTTPTSSNDKKSGADEIRAAAAKFKEQTTEGITVLTGTLATVVEGVENRQTTIDGKMTDVDRRLKNQEGLGGKLDEKVKALEAEVTGNEETSLNMRLMELNRHVNTEVEQSISAVRETADNAATKASVDELRAQVDKIEAEVGSLNHSLTNKLTPEDGDTRYLAKGEIESFEGRCAAVEAALEKVENALKKNESVAPKGFENDLKTLKDTVERMKTAIDGIKSDINIKQTLDVAGGLETVKGRLDAVEKKVGETPPATAGAGINTEDLARQVTEAINNAMPTIIKQVAEALAKQPVVVDTEAIVKETYVAVLEAVGDLAKGSTSLQEFGEAAGDQAETTKGEK